MFQNRYPSLLRPKIVPCVGSNRGHIHWLFGVINSTTMEFTSDKKSYKKLKKNDK